jgi:TonB-linked SusC/RagA family outer membrane protein
MNFYTLFNPVRKKRGRLFKILLVMKLVIILITVACLQVSASALAQKKVTLNEKDAPLEKVFNDIKEQTNCNFLYEHNILNGTSKVTINVKDANISDVLNQCLANQPLVYTIAGNNIGVKKKEIQTIQPQAPQPPKDITGHITDKQGVPLVSATVLIKRTKTGTLTDANGNFTLKDVLPDDILIISYIGYKPASITVGKQTVFNVIMEETKNELDQVVVEAYGKTSQRLNTGNISVVSGEEINRQPVMNALDALQGEAAGVVITPNSGYASTSFHVEIRGRSGINPNLPSDPLYVVDGVPQNVTAGYGYEGNYATGSSGILQNGMSSPAGGQSELFSINPEDIESISVLKDADATSIYGSRGANGVVLVTTKKGKAGKLKVEANVYQGISLVTNYYNLMNTQQYVAMREEAFKNDNITPDLGNAYDLLQWNTNDYTNWQKELWGNTGETTDGTIGFSGGDKQTTFRLSGSYHNQTDILTVAGGDKRASVAFNLSHNSLNQRLKMSFSASYNYTFSNMINIPSSILLPPDAPPAFNSEGQLNYAGWGAPNSPATFLFPFSSLLQPYTSATGYLTSSFTIGYEIVKGLTFNFNLGYRTENNSQLSVEPAASLDPRTNPVSQSSFGINDGNFTQAEPTLEYKSTLSKGTLDLLIGGSDQASSTTGSSIEGFGYPNDQLIYSVSNASSISASNGSGQDKYAAIYGRINYNWEDEYILNLSARRDGSSRFGPAHQYGNFASVGAAWIFTEEKWAKDNLSFLSFGKIRGSYGSTGSDQIGNYQYLSNWGASGAPYQSGGAVSFIPQNLANPNLVWEVDKKLEGALDLGLLKDRLTLEITRYQDRSGNQLLQFPLPEITGFDYVTANFPAVVQNSGWEGTINYKVIDRTNLSWGIRFDIGANQNKLISYPGLAQSPYAGYYTVGQPLNIKKLLNYTGIDPQTGQYSFEDKNHDGQITNNYNDGNNDLYDYNLSVRADGGFGTDFRYKQFQLNVFFHFRIQEMLGGYYGGGAPGVVGQNQPVAVLNAWQKPGDVTEYAKYTTSNYYNDVLYYQYSNGTLSNANYIRLQNLSLSYDLPISWAKSIGMQSCKLYARGQNLFLITKYDGIDPETPGLGVMPPQKIFTIGAQFNL